MGSNKKLLLCLLLFPLALAVRAAGGGGGQEGVIHGYVTDAVTKKPLSGVTVSAVIPGTTGQKAVMTDADGYFRFTQLPTTPVTVQFDKKGYQSTKRANIQVKEKTPTKLNVEFLPDEMESSEPDNSEYPLLRMMQAS